MVADGPAASRSLEAEIDGDQVRGQLLDHDGPMKAVHVTLETRDGASWTTGLDEVGFFSIQVSGQAEPAGSVRFSVRIKRTVASSGWIAL